MRTQSNRLRPRGIVLAGVIMTACSMAGASTLDIEHPVYRHDIDPKRRASYEAQAQAVLALGEARLLALVPPRGVVSFCECPHCYGGVEGNGVLVWSIEKPDQLTCRYCGTVVFPNKNYPENQVLIGKNRLGEEIRLPYYANEKRHTRHFFTGHMWMLKRQWLLQRCLILARAYQTSQDESYARPLVLILDRFAQVYPHYPALHNRSAGHVRFCKNQDPPYNWDAGCWGFFHCEIPKTLLACYDMVCESPEFEKLSKERGYDVRQKIENDFFRETYRIAFASPYVVGNVVGYDIAGMAIVGRILNEPSYVHESVRRILRNVNEGFFRDGFWHESPSYHYMTIGGLLNAFRVVVGYSDPPGYIDAVDKTRFDHFDPERDLPLFARIRNAPSILDFPNGCSTPVHDTWPNRKRSKPRTRTVSTIAPAFGHASLGRGRGSDQMQAQLHFSGAYGHAHRDDLNLTLFAKEHEMLPDLGYTWTQARHWNTSTLAHNTVVVNRTDQLAQPGASDGDLRCYFPDLAGISLVEADGRRGYGNLKGIDTYRRLLLMMPVSAADAYVVDIFRVHGGTIHDWALHGDADEDSVASCNLNLAESRPNLLEAGETWHEPTTENSSFSPYGMVRDIHWASTTKDIRVDFTYAADPTLGIRTHINAGACDVFLGRAPSVRRTGFGSRADGRKLYDFWMPMLVLRRRGKAPLHSIFSAVHEPFHGHPFIHKVERLHLVEPDDTVVALRITHTAGVDTVVQTLDRPPYPLRRTTDGIQLRGSIGIIRQARPGGPVIEARLIEGVELSYGPMRLTSPQAACSGKILDVERKLDGDPLNAFLVEGELPADTDLHGRWLIATEPGGFTQGYEIDRVVRRDGRTRIVLARDPGLRREKGNMHEVYFPGRTFKGETTFTIPLAVALDRTGPGSPAP